MEHSKKMALVILVLGLLSFAGWLISLRIDSNAIRVISIALGAFAWILKHDEKRNSNYHPLIYVGVFGASFGLALSTIGIVGTL